LIQPAERPNAEVTRDWFATRPNHGGLVIFAEKKGGECRNERFFDHDSGVPG
jgi:hypothetical protein